MGLHFFRGGGDGKVRIYTDMCFYRQSNLLCGAIQMADYPDSLVVFTLGVLRI